MAAVCSVEASKLSPEDAAVYTAAGNLVKRKRLVSKLLTAAKAEGRAVLKQIGETHPDLVAEFAPQPEPKPVAKKLTKAAKQEPAKKTAEPEKGASNDGVQERSAAPVDKGEQAGTSGRDGASNPVKRTVARARTKAPPAKTAEPARSSEPVSRPKATTPESEPARPSKPQPPVREKQQPADIKKAMGGDDWLALDDAIATVETATRPDDAHKEAVGVVIDYALFLGKDTTPEAQARAMELLSDMGADTELTRDVLLDRMRDEFQGSDAKFARGKGLHPAWAFVLEQGLFEAAYGHLVPGTKMEGATPEIKKILGKMGLSGDLSGDARQGTDHLIAMLSEVVFAGEAGIDARRRADIDKQVVMLKKIAGLDLEANFGGTKLKDWFLQAGRGPLAWKSGGRLTIPDNFVTPEKLLTGRGKVFDLSGKPIERSISHGKVKMRVAALMSRVHKSLRMQARTYTSVAEFAKREPALYKEAVAAREGGIPENASGYSFGNNVIIFSDNIYTQAQLAFTVTHEVVGHMGLGAVMPQREFTAMLEMLYNVDPNIHNEADLLMETRSLTRREAIEEALADRAALIDNSIIHRIISFIQRALNKMGVTFTDDMTRYFVWQSGRYTRTGTVGDVTPLGIYQNMQSLERRYLAGRASDNTIENFRGQATVEGGGIKTPGDRIANFVRRLDSVPNAKGAASSAWGAFKRLTEQVQTMDNIALRNEGLRELFDVFKLQKELTQSLKTKYAEMMPKSYRTNLLPDKVSTFFGVAPAEKGPTKQEAKHAGRLLSMAALLKSQETTETMLEKAAHIGKFENGVFVADRQNFDALRAKALDGLRKRIQDGAELYDVDPVTGEDVFVLDAEGKPTTTRKTRKEELGFTISDREWELFLENRAAIDEAALDTYIQKVRGMTADREAEFTSLKETYKKALSPDDLKRIRRIADKYLEIYNVGRKTEGQGLKPDPASVEKARVFAHHAFRVLNSKASNLKVKDWENGPAVDPKTGKIATGDERLDEFRLDPDLKDIVQDIIGLGKGKQGKQINDAKVGATIMNLILLENQVINAELWAKGTIMNAYSPFVREGKWQVHVEAYLENGVVVSLPEGLEHKLFYSRYASEVQATDAMKAVNETFKNLDWVEVATSNDSTVKQKVKFRAKASTGTEAPPLVGSVNYDDMAHVLTRIGIHLTPQDREALVRLTSANHSTARSNLQRSGNPGWDPNILQRVAQHLETQTHIAGKNRYQHQVSRVLASEQSVWSGNQDTLETLQKEFLDARGKGNADATWLAYRALAEYQHMFVHSADKREEPWIKVYKEDGTEALRNGKGLAAHYRDMAVGIVSGYSKAHGMPDVTGDDRLGTMSSFFMSGTAMLQLGGAAAPAMVNMVSLASHSIPYLSTLNTKTGYGGGHGMAAATTAIFRAGSDLSLIKDGLTDVTGSASRIRALIKQGPQALKKYNLTVDEAEFLADLTEQGVLTPTQFNELTGSARTGKSSNLLGRSAQLWMSAFSKTEQYNRRVTALASYRLDKLRMERAGKAVSKEALYQRAIRAVDFSQGNYDSFNRPSWARGSILQYVWMYKQFVVITIQLMRNLSHAERGAFLAFLFLTAGLKGLPFAEDFADIIDTLAQMFGFKWAGLEAQAMLLADDLAPGAGKFVLRGFLDNLLGTTLSTRIGQSDLIPMTGILKAGSEFGREVQGLFGPVWSAWLGPQGVGHAASVTGRYLLETAGIREDNTSFADVLRTGGGSSALKGYMQGLIFMADGSVTNDRGQVITKDFGMLDVLYRMLGFYPGGATTQHHVVQMGNDARYYAQAIATSFKDAYIKAGDASGRRRVLAQVREWNQSAKGGPFYLRNFADAAVKARQDAGKTVVGRNIEALPTAIKPFGKRLANAAGLDTEGINTGE